MKLVTIDLDQKISWQEYDPEHEDYNDVGGSLEDFLSFADGIKGIPAVPLDKLCELYEKTSARTPCGLCKKIMPGWCLQHNKPMLTGRDWWDCPTWKQILTKWMEEQDAQTDQPGK